MRLLDRHLLKEMLLPFAFCLGGLLIFWSAAELVSELPDLQKAKLRGLEVAQYSLFQLPPKMVFLLPVSLMLGQLYALTQHTKHNEITAMRAAGISLWRIGVPYLGIGFALSLALFAINEFVAPAAGAAADELLSRHAPGADGARAKAVSSFCFSNDRARRMWNADLFYPDAGEMRQVWVTETLPDNSRVVTHAERAVATNGGWGFFKVDEGRRGPGAGAFLVGSLVTNYLFKASFSETPEEMRSYLKVSGVLSLSGRRLRQADVPIADLLDYLRLRQTLNQGEARWIYTKLHGRLAAPWTCLVVVLLALPFGAMTGRRNVFMGVAGSIFIFFAFFALSLTALAMGAAGLLPPWLAGWLPNLVFTSLGVTLIYRVR
ncbi:MAG: hypothetical protein RLY20_3456 [Verrucomicrobiota bacterium]|jgi:lipopolysaccharide export system permease protein